MFLCLGLVIAIWLLENNIFDSCPKTWQENRIVYLVYHNVKLE